jgi:lysophospholipase L1-like esterase
VPVLPHDGSTSGKNSKENTMTKRAWMHGTALAALLVAGLVSPALAQDGALTYPWIGTWAAAPLSGTESGAAGTSFNQQTLRQTVHTSVAGVVARVQISNTFGTQPLTIGDAHIALPNRSQAGAIRPATARPLTFGGQATITIPIGALALSDPVEFPVPALGDVVVDLYLPNATGPATQHSTGLQTNYIAQGDASGQETLSGAQTTQSYFFLTDLNVQNPPLRGAVVTLGASITDGTHSTPGVNRRWPNDLAQRLVAASLRVGVLNEGIAGNRLLTDVIGPNAQSRFDRDVLAQPGVRWVIFSDDPINDLGFAALPGATAPAPSADALIAGLKQLVERAHQKGVKFFCSTLTPYQGAAYWTPAGETAREQVNAFIRTPNNGCDGIVDQDAATHDPANPTQFLPAYDSGDHLHPNDIGYAAIADAVDLTLFSRAFNGGQ